jgi:hypothetical protein
MKDPDIWMIVGGKRGLFKTRAEAEVARGKSKKPIVLRISESITLKSGTTWYHSRLISTELIDSCEDDIVATERDYIRCNLALKVQEIDGTPFEQTISLLRNFQ